MSPLAKLIKDQSAPLIPQDTHLEEKLPHFPNIRCLSFDIYGTLIISGSGDIGVNAATHKEELLRDLISSYGLAPPTQDLVSLFHQLISEDHQSRRDQGIDFPEVEIREIWQRFFEALQLPAPDLAEFAVRYELLTNPVWPMPGLQEIIDVANSRNLVLSIVSNAQFCTPLLFEAFLGKTPVALGFQEDLSVYSYQHRQAKPGTALYQKLATALSKRGIRPEETLYIGNDALNDVHPASLTGFRTALFAGSARSLRLREDHSDLRPPDSVITSLSSISGVL